VEQKKFIKVVIRQEHILILGFRTTLMKGFDPKNQNYIKQEQQLKDVKSETCIFK